MRVPGTIHACALQALVSSVGPTHAAPPLAGAGLLQALDRFWVPPPHLAEQAEKAPNAEYPPFTENVTIFFVKNMS